VTPDPLPSEILSYYARAGEAARLFAGAGQIELARTQEVLLRHLPPGHSTVLDVGGGPGAYARWLAGLGHAAHLIDASLLPALLGLSAHLLVVARRPA
jgi:hypothetical protein